MGFQIERNKFNGAISLHQIHYIENIITRFGLQDANMVTTPVNTHAVLCKNAGPHDPEIHVPYCEIVGSLMYAMVLTCYDISYAVSTQIMIFSVIHINFLLKVITSHAN